MANTLDVKRFESGKSVCWTIWLSNGSKLHPEYLERLVAQDYEKKLIHLYFASYDNMYEPNDLIEKFIHAYGSLYSGITFSKESAWDVDQQPAKDEAFRTASNIDSKRRQESLDFANNHDFDYYFVNDVENLLTSKVLTELVNLDLPIVTPLLHIGSGELSKYTNFYEKSNLTGQLLATARHSAIVSRELVGVVQVDLVKSTYLVKREVLGFVEYSFSESNYDYQNFGLSLLSRTPLTRQFVDARQYWGAVVVDDSIENCQSLMVRLESEVISFSKAESEKESLIAQNAYFKKKVVSSSRFVDRHLRFRSDNLHIVFDFVFDYGHEIAHTRNSYPILKEGTSGLKPGSIDRALTHIRLLQEAIETNESVIILEDDAKLHKDFDRALEALLSKNSELDTLLLGFNWDSMVAVREHEGSTGIVRQSFSQRGLLESWEDIDRSIFNPVTKRLLIGWGLCATLTSPEGAKKVLNHLRNFQPEFFDFVGSPVKFEFKSFDSSMNALYKDLRSFVVIPPIAWVQNERAASTIWSS